MIKLIAAVTKNWCLGDKGDLVVKNKEDLQLFKKLTEGSTIVMGKNTWKSLPNILPNRMNVVLTNDKFYPPWNTMFGDYERVLDIISTPDRTIIVENESVYLDNNTWIIGGAQIYEKFMKEKLVDEIHLTIFDQEIEGDTYFPKQYLENYDLKIITYFKTFKKHLYVKKDNR